MLEKFKADNEMFHSSFQIENFIIVKSGKTEYGMYKQGIRELLSREQSLRTLYANRMKLEIDFEELRENITKEEEGSFKYRRLKIKEAEYAYSFKDLEKVIKETEREYKHFYNITAYLKDKLGDLSKEKREKLEREYWMHVCKHRLCLDIQVSGRPSKETIELINSFPNDMHNEVNNFLASIQGQGNVGNMQKFLLEYTNKIELDKTIFDRKLPHEVKELVNGTPDNG